MCSLFRIIVFLKDHYFFPWDIGTGLFQSDEPYPISFSFFSTFAIQPLRFLFAFDLFFGMARLFDDFYDCLLCIKIASCFRDSYVESVLLFEYLKNMYDNDLILMIRKEYHAFDHYANSSYGHI